MRYVFFTLALTCCAPPVTPDDDAGPLAPDAGREPVCGDARPEIGAIRGTEGLSIAADGTLYFSQSEAVGRLSPDGALDLNFVALPGASTVWGVHLSEDEQTLFVGSPTTSLVYVVDIETASVTSTIAASGPNGFVNGPDGVYFSDFFVGRVYRVDNGATVEVTSAVIQGANGLAFNEGELLVAAYASGEIVQLTLADGVESARAVVESGLGNPDGVVVDDEGRLLVTDNTGGTLTRVDDGAREVLESGMSAPASIAFARGALDCRDVYVATGGALVRVELE